MKTKILFDHNTCDECHHEFVNGDTVYFYHKLDSQFCTNCAATPSPDTFIVDNDIVNNDEYNIYVFKDYVGYLVINSVDFDKLDKTYYEIRKEHHKYIIQNELENETFNDIYCNKADTASYFLIRKPTYSALLFPKLICCDQCRLTDNPTTFKKDISIIRDGANFWDCGYLCNDNNIVVGVAALSNEISKCESEQTKSEIFADLGLKYKHFDEISAECKSMQISKKTGVQMKTFTPNEMLNYCENRIQGQGIELKKAVYIVYKYLQSVAKGEPFVADNWLLTGISGSGKTEFYRAIRDFVKLHKIPVPIVQIDLSNISEAGFKGDNTSSISKRIIKENPDTNGIGICFLDEADKKCVASYSSNNVNVNAAVQSNLLTLIEGTIISDDDITNFDSGLTMFVLMGAFQELRNDKKKNKTRNSGKRDMGFSASSGDANQYEIAHEYDSDISLQEMMTFGLSDELAGRMIQVVNFHILSEDDMRKLIKFKVQEIADTMGVTIEITNNAVNEFLTVSYGSMGVRTPINRIKEMVQNEIAQVFFDNGFNPDTDKVIIESLNTARIAKVKMNEATKE